jgi:hypothetical protein
VQAHKESLERGGSDEVCNLTLSRYTAPRLTMRTTLLLACCCVFVTVANVLFKLSAAAGGMWSFLTFQAGANLVGLASTLVYTWLMRHMPLHLAFPLSRGARARGSACGGGAGFS